jgi:predicted dithiol-disulfide oxidoreductase (DUF899 family)
MITTNISLPAVATRAEWLAARKQLLAKEKELTRRRDAVNAERRRLPMVRLEKDYVFEGPEGKVSLLGLFEDRLQLIIYHFMWLWDAGEPLDKGCPSCSAWADHIARGHLTHLHDRGSSLALVSRAPIAKISPFKARMGWSLPWYSSFGSDFNYDFNVSFTPAQIADGTAIYNYRAGPLPLEDLSGLSVFYKAEDGAIYHTYSTFGRGAEERLGTYVLLDLTPNGRNENGPNHSLADWVRHHDRYGVEGHVSAIGRWVPAEQKAGCCHDTAAE